MKTEKTKVRCTAQDRERSKDMMQLYGFSKAKRSVGKQCVLVWVCINEGGWPLAKEESEAEEHI